MNRSETAKLLSKAALVDNRTLSPEIVEAWHEVLGHLHYPDALRAVTLHFQRSTEYLKPKHIIDMAAEARRERRVAEAKERATHAIEPPPAKGMPQWFRDWLNTMGQEKASTKAVPTGAASVIEGDEA